MDDKLLKEFERLTRNLLAASIRVKSDLDKRIDKARREGGQVPVFDGIASLNQSIEETRRALRGLTAFTAAGRS